MRYFTWTKLWQYLLLIPLIIMTIKIAKGEAIFWLHNVDLFFHEAGHTLFYFVSEEAHFLGGTLAQLLAPLIFMLYFLFGKKQYSASIMLWWLGENLTDIGIYIADARAQKLALLGNDQHDWTWLLTKWNLVMHDKDIGTTVWAIGLATMCFSILLAIIFMNKTIKYGNEGSLE